MRPATLASLGVCLVFVVSDARAEVRRLVEVTYTREDYIRSEGWVSEVTFVTGGAGPVNVRETAGFCIYCSDPTLFTRVSPTELVLGYGS